MSAAASHESVTCALADARPGAVSVTTRRGLLCLFSGRAQCAGRKALWQSSCQPASAVDNLQTTFDRPQGGQDW